MVKTENKSDTQKRDVEDVGHHRPICSLPALYKLFTTILYSRLFPRLDQIQAEDQAGFRSSYQTTDHLATYKMIDQKCQRNQNVGREVQEKWDLESIRERRKFSATKA